MKLSPAQERVLRAVTEGDKLIRDWDVWGPQTTGGYTYRLRDGGPVHAATVAAMERAQVVGIGKETKPYSGHRTAVLPITEAGRAIIRGIGK